jgi:hypothetical protein
VGEGVARFEDLGGMAYSFDVVLGSKGGPKKDIKQPRKQGDLPLGQEYKLIIARAVSTRLS